MGSGRSNIGSGWPDLGSKMPDLVFVRADLRSERLIHNYAKQSTGYR